MILWDLLIDTSHFGSELVQFQGGGDAQTWSILVFLDPEGSASRQETSRAAAKMQAQQQLRVQAVTCLPTCP